MIKFSMEIDFVEKPEYKFNSFEPGIKEDLIKIHYENHHVKYMDNINLILENNRDILKRLETEEKNINSWIAITRGLLKETKKAIYKKLLNNLLQVYNHNLFWKSISPTESKLSKKNRQILEKNQIIEEFKIESNNMFGSGWVWICKDMENNLKVISTKDAERPEGNLERLLVIDLWEHAYYLQFNSHRKDFIDFFIEKANFALVVI